MLNAAAFCWIVVEAADVGDCQHDAAKHCGRADQPTHSHRVARQRTCRVCPADRSLHMPRHQKERNRTETEASPLYILCFTFPKARIRRDTSQSQSLWPEDATRLAPPRRATGMPPSRKRCAACVTASSVLCVHCLCGGCSFCAVRIRQSETTICGQGREGSGGLRCRSCRRSRDRIRVESNGMRVSTTTARRASAAPAAGAAIAMVGNNNDDAKNVNFGQSSGKRRPAERPDGSDGEESTQETPAQRRDVAQVGGLLLSHMAGAAPTLALPAPLLHASVRASGSPQSSVLLGTSDGVPVGSTTNSVLTTEVDVGAANGTPPLPMNLAPNDGAVPPPPPPPLPLSPSLFGYCGPMFPDQPALSH